MGLAEPAPGLLKIDARTREAQLLNLANDLASTQPELAAKMEKPLKDWMDVNDVRTPSPESPQGKRRKAK